MQRSFIGTSSGKLAGRAGLDKTPLSANRAGDQLVVHHPAAGGCKVTFNSLTVEEREGHTSCLPGTFVMAGLGPFP